MLTAATVKPDYARQLIGLSEDKAQQGDLTTALRAATLGVELYPRSPGLNGVLGILHVMSGDRDRGIAFLRTSVEIDPKGYASPDNLRRIARLIPPEAGAVLIEFASR